MTGREFYMMTMLLEESGLAENAPEEKKVKKTDANQGSGGSYPPGVRILSDDYHGWDSWD